MKNMQDGFKGLLDSKEETKIVLNNTVEMPGEHKNKDKYVNIVNIKVIVLSVFVKMKTWQAEQSGVWTV